MVLPALPISDREHDHAHEVADHQDELDRNTEDEWHVVGARPLGAASVM
jgi:hypothetical protein